MSTDKLPEADIKSLLDATHTWPTDFPFKFIVKQESVKDFLAHFPEILIHHERPSTGGKYVSITMHLRMQSSDEVLAIYAKARGFPGVIAL